MGAARGYTLAMGSKPQPHSPSVDERTARVLVVATSASSPTRCRCRYTSSTRFIDPASHSQPHGRQTQLHRNPQRVQHRQRLTKLTRRLAPLQLNDEPQPSAGGQRQVLLCHTQPLASTLDQLTDLFGCVLHRAIRQCSRPVMSSPKARWITQKIPDRELVGILRP